MGAWTPLPNALGVPRYRGAGACGLFAIGGINGTDLGSPAPTDGVSQLPGYRGCGGPPWLSARPSRFTVAPGHTVTITITMNAATRLVTQPGTYTTALLLSGNTPYPAPMVALTLTARPPATWGRLAGRVTGRACDGTTTALAGATVQVSGQHGTWTLTTDRAGGYALWLDRDNNPATLIVSQPGWQPQATPATITPKTTTTHDFRLSPASCG